MRTTRDIEGRFNSSVKKTQYTNHEKKIVRGEGSRNSNYQVTIAISSTKRKHTTLVLESVHSIGLATKVTSSVEEELIFPTMDTTNT